MTYEIPEHDEELEQLKELLNSNPEELTRKGLLRSAGMSHTYFFDPEIAKRVSLDRKVVEIH